MPGKTPGTFGAKFQLGYDFDLIWRAAVNLAVGGSGPGRGTFWLTACVSGRWAAACRETQSQKSA